MRRVLLGVSLLLAAASTGCLERRVFVTSDPPGALVYANDVELGRTPLEADFTYYGKYDVRVELEGYEPLRTVGKANVPIYEVPPIDLAAMAMPFDIETTVRWHFKLEPALETTTDPLQLEADLVSRASDLRAQLATPKPPADKPEPADESPQGATTPGQPRG
ncbi:MAG: hypothetical protein AMXMBFR58_30620 [Phycisphaerae bacterium]